MLNNETATRHNYDYRVNKVLSAVGYTFRPKRTIITVCKEHKKADNVRITSTLRHVPVTIVAEENKYYIL